MLTQVRPSQLQDWFASLADQGPATVLDVREPAECQAASVRPEGFELITIPMGLVPLRLDELDPQKPLAVLCHHGGRSMQVAYFLQGRGFRHVANIAGGIDAWSAEVDPNVPRY